MTKKLLPNHLSAFIWHFLKPYRWVVFLFISLAFLAGFWGPFNSLLIKSLINTLAANPADSLRQL